MSKHNTNHEKVLWITRTAVLTALLVVLQWATGGTKAFAGQYITGSCVNAVLAVAVLTSGLWSGITVSVLSPFCAKLFGIGPQLIQIVPAISVGNVVFVLLLHLLITGKQQKLPVRLGMVLIAAAAKFVTLYLLVVKFIVPMMSASLKPKQIAVFSAMFSYPQLITALIGGVIAVLIAPVIQKALARQN